MCQQANVIVCGIAKKVFGECVCTYVCFNFIIYALVHVFVCHGSRTSLDCVFMCTFVANFLLGFFFPLCYCMCMCGRHSGVYS